LTQRDDAVCVDPPLVKTGPKQDLDELFLTAQRKFGTVIRVRNFLRVRRVLHFEMTTIKGKEHRTVQDVAEEFGVSTKAVHSWIKKGIISKPPQVEHGVRRVAVFPESYMREARKQVEAHRQRQDGVPTHKST